jgi:hypothetical protein
VNSRARFIVAVCLLVAACESVVGFDYRAASKDPKVNSAQMLRVVTDAPDRAEARAWASHCADDAHDLSLPLS